MPSTQPFPSSSNPDKNDTGITTQFINYIHKLIKSRRDGVRLFIFQTGAIYKRMSLISSEPLVKQLI